jgi:heptosyltransferase-2
MSLFHTDCRFFSGYKPCRFSRPCEGCSEHTPASPDILLINLDALGDVLRTTALLPAIRRDHPHARISWLTRPRAAELLVRNPLVDHVLPLGYESDVILRSRRYDLVLNADKSQVAGALAVQVQAGERRGFGIDSSGAIVVLNPEAEHLYHLGLDDQLKFRENQRTEQDLLAEALGFEHQADGYTLVLGAGEGACGPRRKVGFNTGCSMAYPHKKLSLEVQAEAIRSISDVLCEPVLLLGGPEDRERNTALVKELGDMAEFSPTDQGIRRGAAEVDRCDVVVTGDSLGMHMAIALDKHVVAWFGPTCPQEIDLYGRGVKLLADVACAPCWKPECEEPTMCWDKVAPEWITTAVQDCLAARADGESIDEVRGGRWS